MLEGGPPKAAHKYDLPVLDAASIDSFFDEAAASGTLTLLLFAGDPVRWPEADDLAVILPALVAAFRGRARGAVIARTAESELSGRFKVSVFPSLVLVRGREVADVIAKVKDWAYYTRRIAAALEAGDAPCAPAAVVRTIHPAHTRSEAAR
jgi:hydrogenase-1 operon protein HyaE